MPAPRLLRGLVSALVPVLFVSALAQAGATRVLLHVLAVAGALAAWAAGRKPWSAEDRRLFGACLFFVLSSVPSLAVHPTPYGASRLGLIAMTMLALPVAAGLRAVRPDPGVVWGGAALGALASAAWAVADAARNLASGADATYARAGAGHHTLFGVGMAALAAFTWPGYAWFASRGRWARLVPAAAFLAALLGVVLSSSRGAWAAVGAACLAGLAASWGALSRRVRLGLVGGGLAFALVVAAVPALGVRARLAAISQDVHSFATRGGGNSSLGGRLAAWRVAWGAFRAHPVLGIGVGNYKAEAGRVLQGGAEETYAATLDHAHSEYLAALGTRGLVGFLGLAVFLGAVLLGFARAARGGDPMRRAYGLAGLGAVLAVAVWGLTDSMYERELPAALVTMAIGVAHGMIRARDDELAEEA